MNTKHNPINIIQTVGFAFGVKDVRENEYHRIVVTFYKDATEENKQEVKDYMEGVGYSPHNTHTHKISFRSD